jgi:hypothetical protein
MVAIVINRPLSETEIAEADLLLKQPGEAVLFAGADVPAALWAYPCRRFELDAGGKTEVNYRVLEQVLAFGERKVDGVAIADLLMLEKASIWHYHKFRTYFALRNFFNDLEALKRIASAHGKVILYTSDNLFNRYTDLPAGVELRYSGAAAAGKWDYLSLFHYLLFWKLRIISGWFRSGNVRRKKHLLIDHSEKQACLDLHTLKEEKDNYNLAYLFDRAGRDFAILDDVEVPKLKSGARFRLKRYHLFHKKNQRRIYGESILAGAYGSAKVRKQARTWNEVIKGRLDNLAKEETDPFGRLVISYLMSLQKTTRFFLFKYLAYRRYFAGHPLVSIATIDENSARIKTILDAAKYHGLVTIGIQHGAIHELHPAYRYTEADRARRVVPDYTLLWGGKWKEVLVQKGNYDPETLVIVGQVRTDIIPRLKKGEKRKHFPSMQEGDALVVYASQPTRDPQMRKRAAEDVFKAAASLPGAYLVVKLHPNEKYDSDYYHALAKQQGCTRYAIVLYVDLYLLISLCDVLITCFSTVGTETVYFHKPLIILDHLKEDLQNYYKEGVALQATDDKELLQYLKDILSRRLVPDKNACNAFIRRNAFTIDGKVGERVVDFMEGLRR